MDTGCNVGHHIFSEPSMSRHDCLHLQHERCGLQTIEAVVKEVGSGGKVGLRLSPYNWDFNDCYELDGVDATIELNVHLLKELNKFNLAYVHIVTARAAGVALSWNHLHHLSQTFLY